ncbi:hypothetical protein RDI58_020871 [Solanum bulbocastanum]|uniref:Uncharacterized protein n=1 Tax=Solanum bulbocastanum TaxID=147425 RepID=A0AAN8T9L1_SOLBU
MSLASLISFHLLYHTFYSRSSLVHGSNCMHNVVLLAASVYCCSVPSGFMPELADDGLAWKADCLEEPSTRFSDREGGLAASPMDSPKLSFDIPTSSSTLIGLFE